MKLGNLDEIKYNVFLFSKTKRRFLFSDTISFGSVADGTNFFIWDCTALHSPDCNVSKLTVC